MAKNAGIDSPRKTPPERVVATGKASAGTATRGDGEGGRRQLGAGADLEGGPHPDLSTLLGRFPDDDELRGWTTLSPAKRDKAVARIALMRRWWGDRDGLTAIDAAKIADVTPKRFYQMAAAWRRGAGLSAVGVHAEAPQERATRINPLVNAALQRHVVKVVASSEDRTVEWMRRRLEDIVRLELPEVDEQGKAIKIPSPNVVRAIIVREQNRVAESKLLGESVALDCCPISWRRSDGTPYALFVLIDRGTLRIIGHALGSMDASVEGYARAASSALNWTMRNADRGLPWAAATRRFDAVAGTDEVAWEAVRARYRALPGAIEFGSVTNDRRFGSQFRKYVGERVGKVLLRPSWMRQPPPPLVEGEDRYDEQDAAARVSIEIELHNETMVLRRRGTGSGVPPPEFLELLRFLAG